MSSASDNKSATQKTNILAICGSTRMASSNEKLLTLISSRFKDSLNVEVYTSLAALPHFNPDHDNETVSPAVIDFREKVDRADGVIFCTPEYVFSPPAALKNALEWCVSTTVFTDKSVAIIVAAANGQHTFESLTLILNTLQAKIGDNSRLLIQGARGKFNPDGTLIDQSMAEQLDLLVESLLSTIRHS